MQYSSRISIVENFAADPMLNGTLTYPPYALCILNRWAPATSQHLQFSMSESSSAQIHKIRKNWAKKKNGKDREKIVLLHCCVVRASFSLVLDLGCIKHHATTKRWQIYVNSMCGSSCSAINMNDRCTWSMLVSLCWIYLKKFSAFFSAFIFVRALLHITTSRFGRHDIYIKFKYTIHIHIHPTDGRKM